MDTRLLRHYERELAYVREMGAEFAEAYPKIASRLGIEGLEVLDPFVERLYEGFAFLAARVQLELELQYPAFTQHLLEIVYPHYLAPLPSMAVVDLRPDLAKGDLAKGHLLPRGTGLRSPLREGDQTACLYRTAHDVTLWPLEIARAEVIESRGDLVALGLGGLSQGRAALRLRLRHAGGLALSGLPVERLTLHFTGADAVPWRLYESVMAHGIGLGWRPGGAGQGGGRLLDGRIAPVGFSTQEALLPTPRASFDGYRLVQEYFALPQRFFFARLEGLAGAFAACDRPELDLFVLLDAVPEGLAASVSAERFSLFATPAINLFRKRCDRVPLDPRDVDHQIIPDRTAPMDFEVHSLESVTGIAGQGQEEDIPFLPFFDATDLTAAGDTHPAYYAQRRRMRQRSERQRLRGTRTSYLGSDLYVSLCQRDQSPWPPGIEQLSVTAWVTNRDLPIVLPIGTGETDFFLPDGGPVAEIRAITGPTRPQPSPIRDDTAWRLISHLSLNYLSLSDGEVPGAAAAALREMLALYAPSADRELAGQIEGLVSIRTRPIVRRLREQLLSTPVQGLEVRIEFDESFFEGLGVYPLGAVLERFMAQYVGLNTFTETTIHSRERGEIERWPARSGTRVLI